MGDKTKALFTLYDGHGGDEVAKFAQENFPDAFGSFLTIHSHKTVEKSMTQAFLKIDEDIHQKNEEF